MAAEQKLREARKKLSKNTTTGEWDASRPTAMADLPKGARDAAKKQVVWSQKVRVPQLDDSAAFSSQKKIARAISRAKKISKKTTYR